MTGKRRLDENTLRELTFGLLTVEEAWRDGKNIMVNCLCQCGERWIGLYTSIRGKDARSCGCKATAGRDAWRKFFINRPNPFKFSEKSTQTISSMANNQRFFDLKERGHG